jgi:hypothetical protein
MVGREQSSVYKTQTSGSSFTRDAGEQLTTLYDGQVKTKRFK